MITEFLLARIAEDEAPALALWGASAPWWACNADQVMASRVLPPEHDMALQWTPDRVLAECEAKRRIVELHQRCNVHDRPGDECDACQRCGDGSIWPCDTLLAVASVYADHQDFREEWRLTS